MSTSNVVGFAQSETGRRLISRWKGARRSALACSTVLAIAWMLGCGAPPLDGTAESTVMGGMDMSGGGSAVLTADQIAHFGVTFSTADIRTLEHEVRTVGIVALDEHRVVNVALKVDGYVENLFVDATGQSVRAGEPILELYSPQLVAAQNDLLIAQRLQRTMGSDPIPGLPTATSNLLRAARSRLLLLDVSDSQIDLILQGDTAWRALTFYSAASGAVVEKAVIKGQYVMAGQMLYTIANLDTVWVDAELRETDVGKVKEGSAATVEVASYPGRALIGRVAFIHPTVSTTARTLRVRIVLDNSAGWLRPGMYATVRIATPARRALTVPATALMRTGERTVVFVDMGGGRLVPRAVETGSSGAEFVEVIVGLEPGQRVVTSAQFLLDSESNLAEVMKSMLGQMGSADVGSMPGMEMDGMNSKGGDASVKMPPPPERR